MKVVVNFVKSGRAFVTTASALVEHGDRHEAEGIIVKDMETAEADTIRYEPDAKWAENGAPAERWRWMYGFGPEFTVHRLREP